MYKYFFVVIFVIISLLISGYTLKGKISYTPEEDRIEAFKDIDLRINMDAYGQYLVDKNYYDNMKILNQKSNKLKKYKKYKNRYITSYSDKGYSILYKNNPKISYHYDGYGKLEGITFDMGTGFPCKSVTYDQFGIFDSVALEISIEEQVIFDKNKKFVAHWKGNNCYNEKGELIMTRESK